jgi:Chaperone of endosialidase
MKTIIELFLSLTVLCLTLSPQMQAVVPPPDGGYPGGNTAEGQNALLSLTTGGFNTAAGWLSLRSNTTGSFNTAIGAGTLFANTGDQNTATGAAALLLNTTGFSNTANGVQALFSNTEGHDNSAFGLFSLASNTTGHSNTAVGLGALQNNTTGVGNTANGIFALFSNTEGSENTAIGLQALNHNTTGRENTALGFNAGSGVTTALDVICIGAAGADVNNSCFIGNIHGTPIVNEVPVLINSNGQLGTMSSSRRFKKEIKAMDNASEAIHALKPVTFHYKSDNTNRSEFGLIAEEVAEVNPDLVVRDANGEIYTVRYDAVNAMLLNEFLKEHRAVQELKSNAEKQEATIAHQQKQIEALTEGLQRVSAQLELNKATPQTVKNTD